MLLWSFHLLIFPVLRTIDVWRISCGAASKKASKTAVCRASFLIKNIKLEFCGKFVSIKSRDINSLRFLEKDCIFYFKKYIFCCYYRGIVTIMLICKQAWSPSNFILMVVRTMPGLCVTMAELTARSPPQSKGRGFKPRWFQIWSVKVEVILSASIRDNKISRFYGLMYPHGFMGLCTPMVHWLYHIFRQIRY